ncbi:hypothetical protein Tco_0706950 [Tanacetum coccineum]|uniref:Uncharacterized protein n=1 Tax=Tanacetum coccineum TaxID=301880 RepID=A0ABQ4Y8U1_9ASTR
MPTEMELTLEQTQQGVSYEVLVDPRGFKGYLKMEVKAADRVVAPTPGFAITIPETANEFAIKDTENEAVRLIMFPLSLTGEAKTWLDELNEGTIETWDEL